MKISQVKQFTAAAQTTEWIPTTTGSKYPKFYSMSAKKVGTGSPTFSAKLQVSLDGVNPTDVLTVTNSDTDGAMKFAGDAIPRPALYVRLIMDSLTLDGADAIEVRSCATA